jgi:hypothetical protein
MKLYTDSFGAIYTKQLNKYIPQAFSPNFEVNAKQVSLCINVLILRSLCFFNLYIYQLYYHLFHYFHHNYHIIIVIIIIVTIIIILIIRNGST